MESKKIQSEDNPSPADRLAFFRKIEAEILGEILPLATRLKVIGAEESFPDYRLKELREKLATGVFHWAIKQMNGKIERFLEDGKENFLDELMVLIENPWQGQPRSSDTFWQAFENADFVISSRPGAKLCPTENGRQFGRHTFGPSI